jgi:phosphatidylserine/phosphatidylglycerophosphate/cardiolipin synthase-like enzyme
MNWYKLHKKAQNNLYDHNLEREYNPDWEEHYKPFEEGGSELSNTQNHYHGRNVIWVAEEGQAVWMNAEDVFPIAGNAFHDDKMNALVDRIEQAEDKIYLIAPYGIVSLVGEADIIESRVSSDPDHEPLTTGDEDLDQFLEDKYHGYYSHFEDGTWDQEDEDEIKEYREYYDNMTRLKEAESNGDGDFGRMTCQIRDANHRTFGAIYAGETKIPVMIDDNQMQDIRDDQSGRYDQIRQYL